MAHFPLQWTGAWTIEAFQTPAQPLVIDLFGALRAGRVDEALGALARLGPLLGALGPRLREMLPSGTCHWTLFKYLQFLSGGNGGVTRQPAMRLTASDMAEVRAAFVASGLDVADGTDDAFLLGRTAAVAVSLRGVEDITLPSFADGGRALDEDGVRWDVRHAIAQGFSATLLALNAGLSPAEMRRFVEVAVDEAGGRLQVGVDMPLDSLATAGGILAHAEAAGATHAVLGLPPSSPVGSDDDVYDALAPIAEATGLRLVLPVGEIGVPPHVGGGVPWGAWNRLAALDSVRAVTVTTWMPHVAYAAVRMFSGRLGVGIGTPALLGALPLLAREYGVAWLAPAHWDLWQAPEQPYLVRFLEHAVAGRQGEALDVHWRLAPARGIAFGAGLLEADVAGMAHLPLAKLASWTVGGNGGLLREPALRLRPQQVDARTAMLRSIGIAPRTDPAEFAAGRASSR